MKIARPLDWCKVTQPYGVNFVDFYQKLGLKSHNGIDLRADRGTPCYSAFDGVVTVAGDIPGYGITIFLESEETSYKGKNCVLEAVYGHLDRTISKVGKLVGKGELIGYTDNTGIYTTADHLHFGIRPKFEYGYINNGNHGWIDPVPFFEDKGWDLTPVQKRYMRFYKENDPKWRPWHAYQSELKVAATFIRRLGRIPSNIHVQAATYGAWDYESVMNPAMYPIWATLTKSQYLNGKKVPIRLTS